MKWILLMTVLVVLCLLFIGQFIYDKKGFNYRGYHKNGTKYDDDGYDVRGYDIEGYDKDGFNYRGYNAKGYDRAGFNFEGYNKDGYNVQGYNIYGRNSKGKYNRLFDIACYKKSEYSEDGFLNPKYYPIGISTHAEERIRERVPEGENINAYILARDAYSYGKGVRQIKKTSQPLVREIEERHGDGIVLIYKGYIYIFSEENELITMYKNERIPL